MTDHKFQQKTIGVGLPVYKRFQDVKVKLIAKFGLPNITDAFVLSTLISFYNSEPVPDPHQKTVEDAMVMAKKMEEL
jgi:urea transporter